MLVSPALLHLLVVLGLLVLFVLLVVLGLLSAGLQMFLQPFPAHRVNSSSGVVRCLVLSDLFA